MAGALSSTIPNLITMNLHPIVDKLDKGNHPIWRAQVMATICGARLERFLTGKKTKSTEEVEIKDADGNLIKTTNSEYEDWITADQHVLSYLLASVSKDIRMQVASKSSAAEAWSTIEVLFTSQTRARAANTRLALATTKKGAMKATEYIAKMRALGNEMAAVGRPLEEEELVEYILAGLDEEYDSVVNSVLAKTEPTTVSELVAQIFAFETRVNLRSYDSSGSSVNATSRGHGRGGPSRSGFGRGRGGPSTIITLGLMVVVSPIAHNAKSMAKLDTRPIVAGIDSTKILLQIRSMLLQLPQTHTMSTQTGIWTLEPLTI
jgi:hypothetical protein